MKKIFSLILLIGALLLTSSCTDKEPPYVQPLGIVNYTSGEQLMSGGSIDSPDWYKAESTDNSYDIKETYDISKGNVYIRIPGVYKITGQTDKYCIDVFMPSADTPYSVVLILDNTTVGNSGATHSSPPVYSEGADLKIVLPKGTENNITCGAKNLENGAITVKKGNLTIEGSGKLNITANDQKNGIHCTKDVTVTSGEISINAANHGIYGKEGLKVLNGKINITSGRFGLKSGDSPSEADPTNDIGLIEISGGIIDITSGDNGIDVNGELKAYSSAITVTSAQNGVKANDKITVGKSGVKSLILITSGTDGLDSDTDIEIIGQTDIKVASKGDGIVGKNVSVSTGGDIHITSWGEYSETELGDYILSEDGRYVKINPLNYAGYTFYDIMVSCKGIKALETVEIRKGNIVISSMEDGIHSLDFKQYGGNIAIVTDEDGIHSVNSVEIDSGSLDIHKSYKGIKSARTVISGGVIKIASFSDSVDCPKVNIDGGEAYLLDKIDVGVEGEFKVGGGTVVIVASSSNPCLPTSSTVNTVKASVSKPQLAMHTRYLRVSGGNIDITFKLPKGYTEKLAVTVISDKLTSGEYFAQIGKREESFEDVCISDAELTDAYSEKLIK